MKFNLFTEDRTLFLLGELKLADVEYLSKTKNFGLPEDIDLIDLTDVSYISDCGLALLIEWIKISKARGLELTFRGISDLFTNIIELYGLHDLIYNS